MNKPSNKPRIQKDPETGNWWVIQEDDVIFQHKDINHVSGWLECYQADECHTADTISELALKWAKSGFKGREEIVLVKYLQSLGE